MNFQLNRLDNLRISTASFELMSDTIKKQNNIDGAIIGTNGKYLSHGIDVMEILKRSRLKEIMGIYSYQALMRKPIMLFLLPIQEDEFKSTKEELDRHYGLTDLFLNNIAQCFSIACWLLRDSCVSPSYNYRINLLTGYYSQGHRQMDITLSDGSIKETVFSDAEIHAAIEKAYEILSHMLPHEAKTKDVEMTTSNGTIIWEVDKAMSTEGKSFARAFLLLQEARKTGLITTKIEKYCSLLECLFVIEEQHKRNIARITAAYIGTNAAEQESIMEDMKHAYGARSDASHGSRLNFLKTNRSEDLTELSKTLDDYVRRVITKILSQKELNYDVDQKNTVKKYFSQLAKQLNP